MANRNYLAQSWRIDSLPHGGVSKRVFFETLITAAESGSGELPDGWGVTWRWQNKEDGPWREASFQDAVAASRYSFLGIMADRLRRELAKVAPGVKVPKYEPRELTPAQEAIVEAEAEEIAEGRAEREAERKREVREEEWESIEELLEEEFETLAGAQRELTRIIRAGKRKPLKVRKVQEVRKGRKVSKRRTGEKGRK